jgi:hypothetical protein
MNLSPLPVQRFYSNVGVPLVGGKLFTYVAGTATKQATYKNQGGTLNTNPIILNFRAEANLWLDSALTYKFVLAGPFDTDPPTNPIWSVDSIAGTLSAADITQLFLGPIIYPRTAIEIAAGVVPLVYIYPPGDVRRYVIGAAEQSRAWYCYGHAATYFSATQFFMVGDFTSIYKSMSRVLVLGNAGVTGNLLVISSTFGAGITNVFVVDDSVSPMPNPIVAVSVQVVPDAKGPSVITYDSNYFNGGVYVSNLNTGTSAVGKQLVSARNADGTSNCAVGLVAVPSTYTHDGGSGAGVYLTGGFSTGVSGPYAVLYSQTGCGLDIGTADTSRIGIPKDGSAVVIKTDLTINAGNGATNRSNLVVNGLVDARLAFNSNSVEKGAVYASATEMLLGSTANIDTTITQNGNRVLTFRGGNTTGAATPTLSANKPGANAGVIEWVACKTSTGASGWMAIWGN